MATAQEWDTVYFSTREKFDNMSLIKGHINHSTQSSSSMLCNRFRGTQRFLGRASAECVTEEGRGAFPLLQHG